MHIVEKSFVSFIESVEFKKINTVFIAYSGGVDSQVLLYLASKYLSNEIVGLHVNHGISENATKWENFCKETATKLSVGFSAAHFELADQHSNLEEVARQCRHGFFEENVKEKDVILTGHHLDDQTETFMLRLMRGSGVDGLSAMQQIRDYGKGKLMRPLLEVSKEDIKDFAVENQLEWVEDESNKSSDYDRNFIRNEVMPLLKSRWEKANYAIARSASHCQDTKKELDKITETDLNKVRTSENALHAGLLSEYSYDAQKRMVRLWLSKSNLKMPTAKNLNVILRQVIQSKSDSNGVFKTKEYELRKSFGFIYLVMMDEPELKFEPVDGCELVDVNPEMRLRYKGTNRNFKYVMKYERVPYWLRDKYKASVCKKTGEIKAFGDIKES